MDLDLWDCLERVKLIANFFGADLVVCSHFREEKTPSYSQINMLLIKSLLEMDIRMVPHTTVMDTFTTAVTALADLFLK